MRLLAGKAFFYFPKKHDLAKKRAVLAVSTGHILVLRCKTCALLRAKTSALLRRKTCAVLRARTCALLRANTKETTKGGGRRPPPFVEAAEGRLLCIGSEQSTCPSSQHSTCLASQQGRCLGSQQGTISLLNTGQNLLFNSLSFRTVSLYSIISLYSTASLYSPASLYSTVSLDSGQVFFLGKIKACLACNKPNIEDKIPSKVTSDGLK